MDLQGYRKEHHFLIQKIDDCTVDKINLNTFRFISNRFKDYI